MTQKETKPDKYAELRGKWDVAGMWWCDCPGQNPDYRRQCSRCEIRRPLKGSQVFQMKGDGLQGAGFMARERLYPVNRKSNA